MCPGREVNDVEFKVVLFMPREVASVPISRQVLDSCLETLGVTADTRTDIALALSEACANVVLHAGATAVDITLTRRGNEFVATVQDDGGGFDPVAVSRASETGGVGLIGMLERARLVDGEVRVESAPGRGTLVRMRSPVGRGAQPGQTAAEPYGPATDIA